MDSRSMFHPEKNKADCLCDHKEENYACVCVSICRSVDVSAFVFVILCVCLNVDMRTKRYED